MIEMDFFRVGGTLSFDAPSYVERPADNELIKLVSTGEFCYILTCRQMGKSSLMNRTIQKLKTLGILSASVDLTSIGVETDAEKWYLALVYEISRELNIKLNVTTWWSDHLSLSPVQKLQEFLRKTLLDLFSGHIVIFFDEIDTTLQLPFRDDFFAAIRALYNAKASNADLARLGIVLLGAANPSDLIRDYQRTPFNIGVAVSLEEISEKDAFPLLVGLQKRIPNQANNILQRIFYWTNGHPYLTQKLCQMIYQNPEREWTNNEIDHLVEELFQGEKSNGHFVLAKDSNIFSIQNFILKNDNSNLLLKLYNKILSKGYVTADNKSILQNKLLLSGIVKSQSGKLCVRNRIYRVVFDEIWLSANSGINWTRILGIVSGLLAVLILFFTGLFAYDWFVRRQFDSHVAMFYQTREAIDRLESINAILKLSSPLESVGYRYRARELFYVLSANDQRSLFLDSSADIDKLTTVIEGIYETLADIDPKEDTNSILVAMSTSLNNITTVSNTNSLKAEIDNWLAARKYAKQGLFRESIKFYSIAIDLNPKNPATRYERAKVFTELFQYEQALTDLEQVLSIAESSVIPTPTLSKLRATEIVSESKQQRIPMNTVDISKNKSSAVIVELKSTVSLSMPISSQLISPLTPSISTDRQLETDNLNSQLNMSGIRSLFLSQTQMTAGVRKLIVSHDRLLEFLVSSKLGIKFQSLKLILPPALLTITPIPTTIPSKPTVASLMSTPETTVISSSENLVISSPYYTSVVQTTDLIVKEAQLVFLGNLQRRIAGRPPLKWNKQLTAAARWFAWNSVEKKPAGFCAHQDTQEHWPDWRARVFGYKGNAGSENAFCGMMSPQAAIDGWMESQGHRDNLLNANHQEIGVGYYFNGKRGFLIQDFGFDPDYTPLIINNEAITTTSSQVSLYLHNRIASSAFGLGPTVDFRVSNTPSFENATWESYTDEKSWTLIKGIGWRTVYVQTRDAMKRMAIVTDTIYLGETVSLTELGDALMSGNQSNVVISNVISSNELEMIQFSPGWAMDNTENPQLNFGSGGVENDPNAWGGSAFCLKDQGGQSSARIWTSDFVQDVPMQAYFRVRSSDNIKVDEVARLQVTAGANATNPLILNGNHFVKANTYQEFRISFTYHKTGTQVFLMFEFWRSPGAQICLDAVSIFPEPRPVGNVMNVDIYDGNYRGQIMWGRYTSITGKFSAISNFTPISLEFPAK